MNKPATPLPWKWIDRIDEQGMTPAILGNDNDPDPVGVCRMYGGQYQRVEQDMNYLLHACNEYPKLLEDKRRLVEALRGLMKQNMWSEVTNADQVAFALLAELGERT